MNDLSIPVILAEFLVKSAVILALGFAVLAAIAKALPAEAKHSLWLRIFSVSLVLPILLVVLPRWEFVPDLFADPVPETPISERPMEPVTFSENYTPVGEGTAIEFPVAEPEFQFSWAWILFVVWLGGAAILLLRSVPGAVYLRKIERSAEPAGDTLFAKFNELNSTPSRERTTLLLSPLVQSPFTWGLVRPRIVLPESAGEWSVEDLEMILLHELEHVRRNDARAVLISRLFLALNWVNPFAWIAIRRASQHREEACDSRVIHAGFSSENYAAMLFRQAKLSVSPNLQACATAVAETGTIEKRIKMILNHPPKFISGKTTLLSRLSGIATLLAVLTIGISGFSDSDVFAAEVVEPAADEGVTAIEEKLKAFTLSSVEFSNTPLRDALAFLQQRSIELDVNETDPTKKGVNIILHAEEAGDTLITMKLTNAPIAEALRYITSLASLKYKVEPTAVVILPLTSPTSELYTNVYEVPSTFLNQAGTEFTTARGLLENAGVTFSPGTSAIYKPETSQLIVRNTEDQMELVEAYIQSIADQAPAMSPEVEAYLKKIESIILPSVEFAETPIMDAAEFLQQRSVELDINEPDPAKKGINVVVSSGSIRDVLVSLRLTNVPLSEALRYTAELAGGGLRVDESAVVIGYDESTPRSSQETAAAQARIAANEKKLASIILPSLEFDETPLPDALGFLRQRSVELDVSEADPEKKGLNFVYDTGRPKVRPGGFADPFASSFESGGGETNPATVDLKLSNIPLAAALRYTCDLAGMEYIVEPHNILIRPKR